MAREILAISEKALGPDHSDVATNLDNLAELYRAQGRYAEAEPLYKRSLAILEKTLGPDHPNVAQSLNNLAELYRAQGRYAEAESLYERSLVILEKALEPDHPDVATSLNNLAALYRARGRYAKAEPLYKRSLAIREKALGPDHPLVATSLNGLGVLYDSQGRYTEAEPLYKRGLVIIEKTLGPDHPNVATSLDNQAGLYYAQSRYAEAEALYKRSLAISEKALGPDHPDLAGSLNNLAELYLAQGRYADAEPLYKRSLAILEKALGPDHPDLAGSLNNLAKLYLTQGHFGEAEPLNKRGLAISEKALGPDHPLVATGLNNLAELYVSQGRYAEAEPLHKRSLAINEKALGPDHPNVATGLNNLALLYRAQGRYAEAEPLYKRSLVITEKALGPDHPLVATGLNNLAGQYRAQGRYAEAEPLYKRSLAIREKALGPDHPDVATSLNNLAGLYSDQGRYAEAEPLYKRSLAILEKTLGPDHPDVATSLNNLAELYRAQGRYAEAESLYERSLVILEKALGPDHPNLAGSLNNLAELYRAQGRYADAEPLYKRSLAILEKALGPDHPDVATSLNNLAQLCDSQGRGAEGLSFSRRAVAILGKRFGKETFAHTGGNTERRSRRFYFLKNVLLVHTVGEASAAAESFRVSQFARTSTAAQAVAGMAARFAAGTDALAAIVRERQDLAQRWQRLDAAIVKAVSEPPGRRDATAEAALRQELAAATTKLDALDARITQEFPRFARLINSEPLELADAQALLTPDEAMLVYLVSSKETWLWVLRRDRAAFHRIDIGGKALDAEVRALRGRLDPHLNPTLEPFEVKRASTLYQKILAQAEPLLDGAKQILIVPDGALESLPFGVLVTQPPKADPKDLADHRDVAWFARDHAITVLPSVTSLRALREFASGAHADAPFVGIGSPVLEGPKLASLYGGALAVAAEVRALPPLPGTADELRTVAKALGASEQDLYLDDRASEPLLRQAGLERYRVVAFATHGLISRELPGQAEPALVLTPPATATPDNDGLLTVSEIAMLKLNADWVVLSACNTAASDGTPDAGGLSGLARAFFYAGARSLLVSHWSVSSKATVKLVIGAVEELTKDPLIGRAEALRRAEMAMLDPKSPPEYAHPAYWVPFILAGEGGIGR